jgi:hypothetical protein
MHKINIEYNERLNLIKLSCSEGCKMTSWKEGDDIMEYSSFTVAYCPKDADTSIYYCISDEDDERLMQEQLIEMEIRKGAE